MDFIDIVTSVWNRVLYKCLVPERLFLNLAAGVVVSLIAIAFLQYHVKTDKGFIVLTKGHMLIFILSISLAVILVSPLPFGKWADVFEVMSVFVIMVVLSVTSYMDKQTATFVNGYMVIGLLVNLILCVLGIAFGFVAVSKTSLVMLLCCMVVNVILGLIAYSPADAGLIQMAMFAFVLVDIRYIVFAFVLCELVSHIHYLICTIPKVAAKVRKKEKLRFPFTTSIMAGVVTTLFFIG